MKQTILAVSLIIFGQMSISQPVPSTGSKPYLQFGGCDEIPPKYPGGHKAMVKLFNDHVSYSSCSAKKRIGGRVVIQYVVDTFGNISGIKLLKGIRKDLNQESIRLIKLLKGWIPATSNGRKINYSQVQPLIFISEK